ncbi:MAG: DUF4874 domain-containing protein, partial [Dermatophilaceae bacterium]
MSRPSFRMPATFATLTGRHHLRVVAALAGPGGVSTPSRRTRRMSAVVAVVAMAAGLAGAAAASPAVAAATGTPIVVDDAASPSGKAHVFLRNGDALTWKHDLPAGSYEVVATARGERYEGAPRLDVTVGDRTASQEVASTAYGRFSLGVFTVADGASVVARYDNDRYGGTADTDRNLVLANLWVRPVEAGSTPTATTAPTTTPTPNAGPVAGFDAGTAQTIDTTYTADGSVFLNPERGFHTTGSSFTNARQSGISLVRYIVRLDEYRGGALPQTKLDEVDATLGRADDAGVKVLLKFMYNFPNGPGGEKDATKNIDPPLDVVLGHLDQLKPLFEKHQGVIASLYNGFVGAWGEWHTSSTGLDKEPARSKVWKKMLEVLPKDRMMTVRYVQQYEEMTGAGMTAETAYDGSDIARTGLGNQCFLTSKTDAGTYDPKSIEGEKNVLENFTTYTPMIGETCESQQPTQREDCQTARTELERFHFTSLNAQFYEPTLTEWKKAGCYEEFDRRLGYRFELKSSSIQESVKAGDALSAS